MTKNIRRFATAITLTAVLASTPAFAGPNRSAGDAPDRPAIVRFIQKLVKKVSGLITYAAPTIPIPPESPDAP